MWIALTRRGPQRRRSPHRVLWQRSCPVDRSHGAIWNWTRTLAEAQADPPTAEPSQVAVNETQIEVDGEKKWLCAAIDIDSRLLFDIEMFSHRGVSPAAFTRAKLSLVNQNAKRSDDGVPPSLIEKHDISNTEFLTDAAGYLTALARLNLRSELNYIERNSIEEWSFIAYYRIITYIHYSAIFN